MAYLNTGYHGTPLREIIESLGNHSYSLIECRCIWKDETGEENDDLFGYCSYDAKTKILTPLDGDSYSLDDLYVKWEEWVDTEETFFDNGEIVLTVWEEGFLTND